MLNFQIELNPEDVTIKVIVSDTEKYGLRIRLAAVDNLFWLHTHLRQGKTAIARYVFKKHKLLVNGYTPHLSELFEDVQFFFGLTARKYTKKQVIAELVKNRSQGYLSLIPEHYFKESND